MAIYVATVKTYEESDFFAAYDSTTGRMFLPTFTRREELDAHIFVTIQERDKCPAHWPIDAEGQLKIAMDLRDWLNEIAPFSGPFYSTQTRRLPQAWVEKLWKIIWPENDDPERTPDVAPDELIELFQSQHRDEIEFIVDEFIDWQVAQSMAKAIKPSK